MERRRVPKLGKYVLWKLGVLGCCSENEDHVNDYCIFDHDRLFWKPLSAFFSLLSVKSQEQHFWSLFDSICLKY